MKRKIAGVLGGMGPDATVDFMAAVIRLTPADKDQDHVHMIVEHNPGVPDRQAAMRGNRSGVSKALLDMALRLETAGADFLVMPCNTAHVFLPDILPKIHVPFVHIIDETVAEIDALGARAGQVGILATTACTEAGMYQSALQASGRSAVLPSAERQRELMNLIFRIKCGDRGHELRKALRALATYLEEEGAEVIIAGCTEIPLVLADADLNVPLISSTEVLAMRTVAIASS